MAKRVNDGKTGGNYRVDTDVKKKFISAAGVLGITDNEAIEQAMQEFTKKHIKKVGKK